MKSLVIDTEGSTFQKGHPFSARNKMCLVGLYLNGYCVIENIEYDDSPYGEQLERIQRSIDGHDLLIFFNAKYDCHWLRRYGIKFQHKKIWCCQYAHFCLTGQEIRYPSLDGVLTYYGLPLKYDVVKLEYWDKGIDTDSVPLPILEPYLEQDCISTWRVFEKQREQLKGKDQLKKLIWWGCQDLLVTEEMEWNGLKMDLELSKQKGDECLEQIREIDSKLTAIYGNPHINWNSGDHVSAVLYGGVLKYEGRETVERTLKSGRVTHRERNVVKKETLEQLVEPLKGSALKKDGYFSTDWGTLVTLKAYGKAKQIIVLILERAKIEKKVSTYYHGFPKLYVEKDWSDNILHGQLNHCVTRTGRLSSSAPNQQNMDDSIKQCIISRFN